MTGETKIVRLSTRIFPALTAGTILIAQLGVRAVASETVVLKASAASTVDSLTKLIVSDELKLLEISTRLQLAMLPRSPWANRRQFLYQFPNSVLTATGALRNAWGRFRYLDRSGQGHNSMFITAAWLRAGANFGSVAGSTVDMALDVMANTQDKQNGVDLPTLRKYALSLTHKIDSQISQRAALFGQPTSGDIEGKTLQATRNAIVDQYTLAYADAKANRMQRNAWLWLTWLANFDAGAGNYAGSIKGPLARRHSNRDRARNGGISGITDAIAASIIIATPFIQQGTQRIAKTHLLQKIRAEAGQLAIINAKACPITLSKEVIQAVPANISNAQQTTLNILGQQQSLIKTSEQQQEKRWLRTMPANIVTGPTKLTNAITTMVGSFSDDLNGHKRFAVTGGGATAYGVGYCAGGAIQLANEFIDEMENYRAKKNHTGARERLSKQLATLEEASASINCE